MSSKLKRLSRVLFAFVVVVGLSLNTGTSGAEHQWRSAVNDDANEQRDTEGVTRVFTLDSSQPMIFVDRVVPGLTYHLRVEGTWSYAHGSGRVADAECTIDAPSSALTGSLWRSQGFLNQWGEDTMDLRIVESHKPIFLNWAPEQPMAATSGEPACSANHVYTATYTPGQYYFNFDIYEAFRGDNSGSLKVTFTRPALNLPRDYPCPKWIHEEPGVQVGKTLGEIEQANVMVDTREDTGKIRPQDKTLPYNEQTGHWGIYTCNHVVQDAEYHIHVDGTYTYNESINSGHPGLAMADAECSTGTDPNDPESYEWKPKRFEHVYPDKSDVMDLWIDFKWFEWTPVYPDPDTDYDGDGVGDCAGDPHHTYELIYKPSGIGPIHFHAYDVAYEEMDNRGSLCMEVHKIDGSHPPAHVHDHLELPGH